MNFQKVILFWTSFVTLSHCYTIGDQLYGSEGGFDGMGSSEEMYSGPPSEVHFHPQQEFNPGPVRGIYSRPIQGFYPEPHQRNLIHHLPSSGPSMYEAMPLVHFFNPEVMGGILDNPLKTMMDPMRKQMTDSMKGMGDNMGKQMENAGKQMGEAGQKAMDTMQKPAEDLGKEMEEAMENAQDEFGKRLQAAREGAEEVGTEFGAASNTSDAEGKKKAEGSAPKKDGSGEEMTDAMKKVQDSAGDAAKKMQDAGKKVRKSFPIPTAPLLGRIKDETTEVHDYEGDFPRAEAVEWGSPDFVDVRHHPRSQFYDYYYDGGY